MIITFSISAGLMAASFLPSSARSPSSSEAPTDAAVLRLEAQWKSQVGPATRATPDDWQRGFDLLVSLVTSMPREDLVALAQGLAREGRGKWEGQHDQLQDHQRFRADLFQAAVHVLCRNKDCDGVVSVFSIYYPPRTGWSATESYLAAVLPDAWLTVLMASYVAADTQRNRDTILWTVGRAFPSISTRAGLLVPEARHEPLDDRASLPLQASRDEAMVRRFFATCTSWTAENRGRLELNPRYRRWEPQGPEGLFRAKSRP